MRVYVLKRKQLVRGVLALGVILALVLVVLGISRDVLEVFSPQKELPIYSVELPEKKVAITFDCAWGSDDIPSILQTLEHENVKATFFIVGQWAEQFPDKVRMIAEQGHDVANHSSSHLRMGAMDRGRITSEISTCGKLLENLSKQKVDLFRAPYGDYSNNTVAMARNLGYYTIQWDVDSLDWKPGISQQEILQRVTGRVKAGSIILFHNDTKHTADLLPTVITALKSKGYDFVPVSRMILRQDYFMDYDGRQKLNQPAGSKIPEN